MAGPGRGSPQRVNPGGDPPAAGDAEPIPIHGLNGTYDLASFVENSAGNRPLQGNQVGWKKMKPKTNSELFMDYFDFSRSISPKRRSQQTQIKISQDRERIIVIIENRSLPQKRPKKRNIEY